MENKLIDRGYDKLETAKNIKDVKYKIKRCSTLSDNFRQREIPLTLVTKYNPTVINLNRAIKKHWQILQRDE